MLHYFYLKQNIITYNQIIILISVLLTLTSITMIAVDIYYQNTGSRYYRCGIFINRLGISDIKIEYFSID